METHQLPGRRKNTNHWLLVCLDEKAIPRKKRKNSFRVTDNASGDKRRGNACSCGARCGRSNHLRCWTATHVAVGEEKA